MNYPQTQACGESLYRDVNPSLSDKLKREKKQLESRLSEVNNVLDKLDKNPEFADTMDAISKLGHI